MLNIQTLKLKLQKTLQIQLKLSLREANSEINRVLAQVLNLTSAMQIIDDQKVISNINLERIDNIVKERLKGIPLQYILGSTIFMDFEIQVNEDILIPRPETETLVEIAIEKLKKVQNPCILEIGTGSGCISIALAKYLKQNHPKIYATDISKEALNMANLNIKAHNLQDYIQLSHCNLINDELLKQSYDLLISNPPYISNSEYKELEQEVRREPFLALVGDCKNDNGLLYYKQIANLKIKANLKLFEIDHSRSEEIKKLFMNSNHYSSHSANHIEIIKDLNGLKRFLLVE